MATLDHRHFATVKPRHVDDGPSASRVQPLEPDFGALIIAGVELAADERKWVELNGHTLAGERITRKVPVCGPGAFVVLKARAFADRAEPKDAYDLVYVVRRWPGGAADIAGRLAGHAARHGAIVRDALERLASDFRDPDRVGPLRAAEFDTLRAADIDRGCRRYPRPRRRPLARVRARHRARLIPRGINPAETPRGAA